MNERIHKNADLAKWRHILGKCVSRKAGEPSGSKREEWSDFRATSDQSARRVSTGTDVPGKNRFSSGILLLKNVNRVL